MDHSLRVKRRFLVFCTLAVVPCGIASGTAARAADNAWEELAHVSAVRIARLALGTLEQDLGAALDSLLGSADPLPSPDTTIEAVRLAMAGDTVSALDPTASGVELMVVFPDAEGLIRFANGMLVPRAAVLVGRVARARVGLYLNGELWSATDPPPSVETIDRETLLAASRTPGGVRSGAGSVVAMDPRRGLPAAIAALAQPEGPGEQAVPLAVRLVIGLLLLFSTIAAWILFAKENGSEGEPAPGRAALVLLACVPLFIFLGMLVHVQRTFDAAAREHVSRDLVQTLTVVGTLGIGESPAGARALSGFHAARIEGRVVTASTLAGDTAALAAVPAPPPSFTTSGVVETGAGRSRYVARRIDRESFMVLLAPIPLDRIGALRKRLMLISGMLVGWLLLVAGSVTVHWNRTESR